MKFIRWYRIETDEIVQIICSDELAKKAEDAGLEVSEIKFKDIPVKSRYLSEWNLDEDEVMRLYNERGY